MCDRERRIDPERLAILRCAVLAKERLRCSLVGATELKRGLDRPDRSGLGGRLQRLRDRAQLGGCCCGTTRPPGGVGAREAQDQRAQRGRQDAAIQIRDSADQTWGERLARRGHSREHDTEREEVSPGVLVRIATLLWCNVTRRSASRSFRAEV